MPDVAEPFMEHPTDDFFDAVSAVESAIDRLRALDPWDRWITFSGQGQGSRPDSYHIADVRVRGEEIRLAEGHVDLATILKVGGLERNEIDVSVDGPDCIRVRGATSAQFAKLLDGLFRGQLGIREFDDEGDYAVGAEWCEEAG